jgi:hypothetical protein
MRNPEAVGEISRLAYAHAVQKGANVDILLRKAGLSERQIEDPDTPLEVQRQIKFLNLVAEALNDAEDCLKRGLEAQAFSGREIGSDDDVLNLLVRHFVDVGLTRRGLPCQSWCSCGSVHPTIAELRAPPAPHARHPSPAPLGSRIAPFSPSPSFLATLPPTS